ncbi:tRNA lysidine(34) synthetase TilS [Rhodopila sp.]|uniref:tRNA lysidine(34) synthetase TilS n=1 Tax=Rhodopila sp. TaxID=2480087 RepID=UPI003D0D5A24
MTEAPASALDGAFAAAMDRLGPFEPKPALSAAVSGGADSTALALLAHDWVRQRQGRLLALVVDHGLRPESAREAQLTIDRLGLLGIAAILLPLTNLRRGPALAERARIMRYQALAAACRSDGSVHLLLGHHAADQAETMMMRVLRRSLTHGLAAMPAALETPWVRLLRPLLTIDPDALRRWLRDRGIGWTEDPSNHDLRALRPRLRHRAARHMSGAGMAELTAAACAVANQRAREEAATAAELARRATIRPEGFALLSPGRISAGALASLVRMIGGALYGPSLARIDDLAAWPRPATLAGVRILPAGRMGAGFLLVREDTAAADPVAAQPDMIWDGRFRLIANDIPAGATIGKLAADATHFRRCSSLPSAVLRTLPALRYGKTLAAVPHLRYAVDNVWGGKTILFEPGKPLAGSCFVPTSCVMDRPA